MPEEGDERLDQKARMNSSHPAAKHTTLAGFVALVVLTGIAYFPALRGGFIWDDDDYITKNQTLRNVHGLGRIWFEFGATRQYYPLVYTSFWIENHLWGLQPAGYHVVNVLLHGTGAGLLWLILRRLAVPAAFIAAAAWALHPVNVESVAWVTERKNVLSGVFYFASGLEFLRWARIGSAKQDSPGSSQTYAAAIALFICALLSKSVTCTLPVALLIIFWWKRGRLTRRDLLAIAPFFSLGLVLGLTTARLENTNVGAGGPEWHRPYLLRLITAGQAFWFYLGKIVWPHPLIFVYPKWRIDPSAGLGFVALIGAIVLFAILWASRQRIGRGPAAAMLFYLATIAPALGFFNIYYAIRYSPVADHFAYLAIIGPITLVIAIIAGGIRAATVRERRATLGAAIGLPCLVTLGLLTWQQGLIYTNLESLWTDTVQKNPEAGIAQHGLGNIAQKRGQYAEAQERYERAITTEPPDSRTFFNLGTVLQNQGKLDEAQARYEEALRLEPDYAKCLVNYGALLVKKGRIDDAILAFAKAIRAQPGYILAHENLAKALDQAGRHEQAAAEYREVERLRRK
ncbi:MAG TPA: tetratricopeptide repeat protein [Phycisphaerae bacterium]|nr:tetratricopeptide repeat protein [Phycisphaerae bacterium]